MKKALTNDRIDPYESSLKKIKSRYIFQKVFGNLTQTKILELIRYCKRLQCKFNKRRQVSRYLYSTKRIEVTRNINIYASRGVDVGITTVVTEENIHRMSEMMEVMHRTIPQVEQVSFKPLVPNDSFTRFASKEDYYQSFVDNFFAAKQRADELGIRLTCPYLNAVSVLQDRFCEGKFVLAADGNITGCNFVSSALEPKFEEFKIGSASELGCNIDNEIAHRVFSHNNSLELCCDCPAKYHCAGGCYAEHVYMTPKDKEIYCDAMRLFLAKYLEIKYL